MNNIGYACDNLTLENVSTSRGVRKATWQKKGLDTISNVAIQNVTDLRKIMYWNIENGYKFFRISSDLIPWVGFYEPHELKDWDAICTILKDIGNIATENGIRLSFHPGQFCVLASPDPDVVDRAIVELNWNSKLFDLMGFVPSHYNKINIHIGGAYGNKPAAMKRWIRGWKRLDDNTRKRVVVENDDKPSMYTVQDLYDGIHKQIGIPITFDFYHHSLNPGELTEQQALELAISTWPSDVTPATHYSECRRDEQQRVIQEIFEKNNINYDDLPEWPTFQKLHNEYQKTKITAHSDYIENEINTYGHKIDVMVEAKAKNLATDRYIKMYKKDAVLLG
jgi:UV DNA damage endonuclease